MANVTVNIGTPGRATTTATPSGGAAAASSVAYYSQPAADDQESNEIARQRREQSDAQQRILAQVANKERKLDMSLYDPNLVDPNVNSSTAAGAADGYFGAADLGRRGADDTGMLSASGAAYDSRSLLHADLQRRDETIQQLNARVAELSRRQADEANQKAQMDIFETQMRLREEELSQKINVLSHALESKNDLELELRAAVDSLKNDKLTQTKNYTVTMGDLEAKLAATRAELEQRELLRRKTEYELGVTRRELDKQRASATEFENTQLSIQQQIEEKIFAMKKEKASVDEQLNAVTIQKEQLSRECKDYKEAMDMKQHEFALLTRAKESQSKLLESVQKELDGYKEHNSALKTEANLVPQLRFDLERAAEVANKLRETEVRLNDAQAQNRRDAQLLSVASEENAKLHGLNKQFDESVQGLTGRLLDVTGELERTRKQAQAISMECDKAKSAGVRLQLELDTSVQRVQQLETKYDTAINQTSVELNNLQRLIDAVVAGHDVPLDEKQLEANNKSLVELEGLRNVLLGLRSSSGSALIEIRNLRAHKQSIITQLESTNHSLQAQKDENLQTRGLLADTQSKLASEEKRSKSLESRLTEEKRAGNELWVRYQQMTKDMQERVRYVHGVAENVHGISRLLNDLGDAVTPSAPPSPSNGDSKEDGRNLKEREDQKIARVLIAAKQNISGFASALNSALAVQFSPSKSSSAPAMPQMNALDDAWQAVRDLITDLLPRVNERSRQILTELHDAQKAARENENRVRQAQAAIAEQQRQSAETIKRTEEAARDAVDRVKDEAVIKQNALANDARQRLAALEGEKNTLKQANAALQLAEHKNGLAVASFQTEMAKMNRVIQHFAASCRLLYRGYQPLQTRCNELIEQKKLLLHQNRGLERLKADVFGLMQAMTGDKPKPAPTAAGTSSGGSKRPAFGPGKRPSMRATAIMCLAALRILRMGKLHQFYGLPAKVRGETVYLTPPDLVSPDDNLPRIDLSTLDLAATSFSRLTYHFNANAVLAEELPSLAHNLMSALSVGFFRYTAVKGGKSGAALSSADQALLQQKFDSKSGGSGSSSAGGDDSDEVQPVVAVIRKVTLALANRIRDLEKEHKNYTKEMARLKRETSDHVKQREEVAAHYTTACLEIKNLEEKLKDSNAQMSTMISSKEFDQLRAEKDAAVSDIHNLQSEFDRESREHKETRRTLDQALLQVGSRDQQIATLHKSNDERTSELNTFQLINRQRAADILLLERERKEKTEHITETTKQLNAAVAKQKSLSDKLRATESELNETRTTLQRVQQLYQSSEAAKQQSEGARAAVAEQLKAKEREANRSATMIATIAKANQRLAPVPNDLDLALANSTAGGGSASKLTFGTPKKGQSSSASAGGNNNVNVNVDAGADHDVDVRVNSTGNVDTKINVQPNSGFGPQGVRIHHEPISGTLNVSVDNQNGSGGAAKGTSAGNWSSTNPAIAGLLKATTASAPSTPAQSTTGATYGLTSGLASSVYRPLVPQTQPPAARGTVAPSTPLYSSSATPGRYGGAGDMKDWKYTPAVPASTTAVSSVPLYNAGSYSSSLFSPLGGSNNVERSAVKAAPSASGVGSNNSGQLSINLNSAGDFTIQHTSPQKPKSALSAGAALSQSFAQSFETPRKQY